VQLRLPFLSAEPACPPGAGQLSIGSGAGRFAVYLVRMRRAKRYIMRLRADGALRVTIPRGGSRAEALRFAERHLAWAVRQRARQQTDPGTRGPWTAGTEILLDGVPQLVTVTERGGRSIASLGRIEADVTAAADFRPAIRAALRAAAARELPPALLARASAHGLSVRRVSIRDQRSRWGSCSSSGAIALNYRLLQMPPDVRDYILVHELAHLAHANHSRRFWRCVESMCPGFRAAEQWLKSTGRSLF